MQTKYDVVVIGGGAAGLAGAVALCRSRRSVLVLDAGQPRNAPSKHVHNFLTREGAAPAELVAAGVAEVRGFGGEVEGAAVEAVRVVDRGFDVTVGGAVVHARRVLLATGVRDELPDVDGLAARWGIDVLHCPYCHGWEVRDQRIGVLATGAMTAHQALLFRQLSAQVTVLAHTGPAMSESDVERLAALDVPIVAGTVVAVESGAAGLTGVRLADGAQVALDALVVAPRVVARAELVEPLGLMPVDVVLNGHVLGTQLPAEPTGATAVPGLYVAGNVVDVGAQVVGAAGRGTLAGAAINFDLVAEDADVAVEHYRRHRIHGEQAWDERYREREQTWSGEPNAVLVAEAAQLIPGTALDAGAGEGGDACWLAERGWQVTGADISGVALERAAAQARRRGLEVSWLHLDLSEQAPPEQYDLVTAHFLHMPHEPRRVAMSNLAAAVAPGGTLLIVGHDPSDTHSGVPRPGLTEMGWSADTFARELGAGWTVLVSEARPRAAVLPDGTQTRIADAVVRARRDR